MQTSIDSVLGYLSHVLTRTTTDICRQRAVEPWCCHCQFSLLLGSLYFSELLICKGFHFYHSWVELYIRGWTGDQAFHYPPHEYTFALGKVVQYTFMFRKVKSYWFLMFSVPWQFPPSKTIELVHKNIWVLRVWNALRKSSLIFPLSLWRFEGSSLTISF